MRKGPTHRLQPPGSLISSARLRSGPTRWLNPGPGIRPKIFLLSDSLPACHCPEQGFFRSLPHLAARAELLEIATARPELVQNSSSGWAQAKKEALWAFWLIWALRTDSTNTGLILPAQR